MQDESPTSPLKWLSDCGMCNSERKCSLLLEKLQEHLMAAPNKSSSTASQDDSAAADEFDGVALAAEAAAVASIYHQSGLSQPIEVCASVPQAEDGESEEEVNSGDRKGVRTVAPKMSYQAAMARLRSIEASARASGQPPVLPQVKPARYEQEWIDSMLPMMIDSGLKVAPKDYPVEAAYTTVPSMGLAFILNTDNSLATTNSQ